MNTTSSSTPKAKSKASGKNAKDSAKNSATDTVMSRVDTLPGAVPSAPSGETSSATDQSALGRLQPAVDMTPPQSLEANRNPAFHHLGMHRIDPATGKPYFDITGEPMDRPDRIERARQSLFRLAQSVRAPGGQSHRPLSGLSAGVPGTDQTPASQHRMTGRLAALYKAVCPVHGDYFCNKIVGGYEVWIPPGCPVCRAEAIREVVEANAGEACELHVPTLYADCTLENYNLYDEQQAEVAARVLAYAQSLPAQLADGRSLVFLGNSGVGKSHLAFSLAKKAVALGHKAEFFVLGDLLNQAWKTPIEQRQQWLSRVTLRADLLILDELGRHSMKDGSRNLIFELINTRTNERKSTIYISNHPQESLKSMYGEEVWSRIAQSSEVLTMCWANHRDLFPGTA